MIIPNFMPKVSNLQSIDYTHICRITTGYLEKCTRNILAWCLNPPPQKIGHQNNHSCWTWQKQISQLQHLTQNLKTLTGLELLKLHGDKSIFKLDSFKILINCRSWTSLDPVSYTYFARSSPPHGKGGKLSTQVWKQVVGKKMTCPCFSFEPTKVYGSTSVILLKDFPKFHNLKKKTTQKSKVGPIQAMMIRFSTLITTQAVKLHSHHTSKSTASFPFQKVTTE